MAWFDLDGLKRRNDQSGHAAGDQLIRAAARALSLASRRGVDEVFRLHTRGDELLVLLRGPLDPGRLASKFRQELRRQGVSASGGLAYSTELGYLPARVELRAQAETACRQAKARGGDCVCVAALSHPLPTSEGGEDLAILDAPGAAIPEPIADPPALSPRLQGVRP